MLLRSLLLACAASLLLVAAVPVRAQEPDAEPTAPGQAFDPPANAVRLSPKHDVWIDVKNKSVLVDGEVCLRDGQLEMFACPRGTKEHESVVSLKTRAYFVHAGLLAIGAKAGNVVKFDPEYAPAWGDKILIEVQWYEDGKLKKTRAQEWVQQVKTGKAMPYDWVFAGSGFWVDPENSERHYQAESGDFICVSNFPTATLDLPIESSQGNAGLLFSAFTEHIPPLKTPVRLVLTYEPSKKDADEKKAEPKDGAPTDN
ncbi:YdjY domain-containing protein [Lignipirellula cremea]|uniref:Uncharacterized protein n=1 Tax=Lignipirellula cremea TaxID=2528010 RepID=A0A518DPV5_9BACT|nr:YdjY domain-containing protein [Lignipirellula cremea]QDU93870.1 hypothetical protein Pla8534_16540 [Lignipirellula cremea]